eukprot:873616-Prorocentrum_minimum.AAC.2
MKREFRNNVRQKVFQRCGDIPGNIYNVRSKQFRRDIMQETIKFEKSVTTNRVTWTGVLANRLQEHLGCLKAAVAFDDYGT